MPANRTGRTAPEIFATTALSAPELAAFLADFDRDGYVVLDGIMTPAGAAGLAQEMTSHPRYLAWLEDGEDDTASWCRRTTGRFGLRPWNDKGPYSDQTIDAPLIRQLLGAVMTDPCYPPHFDHSTFSVSLPGSPAGAFHQDHHHFRRANSTPTNIAERKRGALYVQMLYYPVGFCEGDGSVAVIPHSHRLDPLQIDEQAATMESPFSFGQTLDSLRPPPLLAGLKAITFSLPPGSVIFLNARTYHAYTRFSASAGQTHRLFGNVIYKEGGPPHRFTQPIDPCWLEDGNGCIVSDYRKKLLDRQPFSADTEDVSLPNAWQATAAGSVRKVATSDASGLCRL
jgi:hypothetical protein